MQLHSLMFPGAGPNLGFLDHFGALTDQLSEPQAFSLNLPKIQQFVTEPSCGEGLLPVGWVGIRLVHFNCL